MLSPTRQMWGIRVPYFNFWDLTANVVESDSPPDNNPAPPRRALFPFAHAQPKTSRTGPSLSSCAPPPSVLCFPSSYPVPTFAFQWPNAAFFCFVLRPISKIISSRNPSFASFLKLLHRLIFPFPKAFTGHSFVKYFVSTYYTPGYVLRVEHIEVKKWSLISEFTVYWGWHTLNNKHKISD